MIEIAPQRIEDIIRHVAATLIIPRFRNLHQSEIREKNPDDFVTIADEESEQALTQLLIEALPDSVVVGEEAVAKDRSVLYRLAQKSPVWVIDPIDGTYNFMHGRNQFGVFVSLVVEGQTEYGWAFDVPGNRMAFAKRGGGAFLDGKKFTISCNKETEKELIGMTGGAHALDFKAAREHFKNLMSVRCSLHDFMNFFTGEADFIVHVSQTTPWDHSAGCLIAEEAGAYISMNDGEPYDPTLFAPDAFLMVTPNKDWWQKTYPILRKSVERKWLHGRR